MSKATVIDSAKNIRLAHIPTRSKAAYRSDKDYEAQLDKNLAELNEYQALMYADHSRSLLIIFQGMDTAGKDGAIKHVMSGINPQGCAVVSFKSPTPDELEHDFLWKSNRMLPPRGKIGIFNRSYYEEALITRVHTDLLEKEKLPRELLERSSFWNFRYRDIVNHEKYLHRQGYEIVKIFIHISKEEQKRRLLDRFTNPKKLWKVSESDLRERSYWDEYQRAYEKCIKHTSTKSSPWYIVPGDDKRSARLNISKILVERFKQMKLDYPKLSATDLKRLEALKTELNRS